MVAVAAGRGYVSAALGTRQWLHTPRMTTTGWRTPRIIRRGENMRHGVAGAFFQGHDPTPV